jgi:hypothetical protein
LASIPFPMKRWILPIALLRLCYGADAIDVQELVRRAGSTMQSDWAAAPDYAFIQRDVTTQKGMTTRKTHQVFNISGSDYYMPIANEDVPLSAGEQQRERQRLTEEVKRRSHETAAEAQRRSELYTKAREQNGILLLDFTKAFDFTLQGEEMTNGHATYVLEATPRADYRPPNRTARILTGMHGRLWIEKEGFHWVKGEAEVLTPVSIFGFLAKVLPGTRMDLEMTPVTESVWLVSRFAMDLKLSKFWHRSTKITESTFRDYRPAAEALAETLTAGTEMPGGK